MEIFWVLSGFIFFTKYLSRIQNKSITGRDFFFLRFSRLYPLHLMSLCLVAILQILYFSTYKTYFAYQQNHPFDFLLNLFMANSWGTKARLSFNVPIWSVSAEVLIYFLFFIHIRKAKNIELWMLILTVLSVFLMLLPGESWPPLSCLLYFYLGGAVCYSRSFFIRKNQLLFSRNLAILMLIGFPIISWKMGLQGDRHFWQFFLVFWTPILVYLASSFESFRKFTNVSSFLGNLTYSAYLIHFPIQIIFVVIARKIFGYVPLYNLFFMLVWVLVTFGCSFFIFQKFEVPCQRMLRKCLMPDIRLKL